MVDKNTQTEAQEELLAEEVAEESAPIFEEPKTKPRRRKKKKIESVHDAIRKVYKYAPADMLDIVEARAGSDTIADLAQMNMQTVNSNLQSALYHYANAVIGGSLELTKTLENRLRGYAEDRNLDYNSMFTARGVATLVDAIREETGNVTAEDIISV